LVSRKSRLQPSPARFKPEAIDLLLVAESPPNSLDRYFYFDDVTEQDSLFRYVSKMILGELSDRSHKSDDLARLRDAGVFLIDVKEQPGKPAVSHVGDVVERCRQLSPPADHSDEGTVYDLVYTALLDAGLPVVDERIPFPGSGQQKRFEEKFKRALAVLERR